MYKPNTKRYKRRCLGARHSYNQNLADLSPAFLVCFLSLFAICFLRLLPSLPLLNFPLPSRCKSFTTLQSLKRTNTVGHTSLDPGRLIHYKSGIKLSTWFTYLDQGLKAVDDKGLAQRWNKASHKETLIFSRLSFTIHTFDSSSPEIFFPLHFQSDDF